MIEDKGMDGKKRGGEEPTENNFKVAGGHEAADTHRLPATKLQLTCIYMSNISQQYIRCIALS